MVLRQAVRDALIASRNRYKVEVEGRTTGEYIEVEQNGRLIEYDVALIEDSEIVVIRQRGYDTPLVATRRQCGLPNQEERVQ